MKIRSCLSDFVKNFDLFSLTQFLRYRQDEDYTTASGGITSIIIVGVFIIFFASNAISTVNKTDIKWQAVTQNSFEPVASTLSFNLGGKSMFGLGVTGLDLNDPSFRYLDAEIIQTLIINQTFYHLRTVPLVQCTIQHFSQTQAIKNSFASMGANRRMCPPLNTSFDISGRFTTKELRTIEIRLSQCNSSLTSTRPCADPAIMSAIFASRGQLYASVINVRPMINPGSSNYLDYYVEDKTFLSFSPTLGAYSIAYIKDFRIQTDQSLLPFTDTRVDEGIQMPQVTSLVPYSIYNSYYARFYFMKSSDKTIYKRSFNKIDDFFSYVGGLIGTILGFLLFMEKFSLMAFELDIAQRFVRDKGQQKMDFSSFNVFSYFSYLFYKAGSSCGFCQQWVHIKKEVACREEMIKQLDVQLFLQRFNFLERAVERLFDIGQIDSSQFYKPETLETLRRRRKKYRKSKQTSKKQIRKDNDQSSKKGTDDEESEESESDSGSENNKISIASFNHEIDEHIELQPFEADLKREQINEQPKREQSPTIEDLHGFDFDIENQFRRRNSRKKIGKQKQATIQKINPKPDDSQL